MITEASAIVKIGRAKYNLLAIARVRWLPDELVWVSETSNKVFSFDWILDSELEAIRRAVAEQLGGAEWRFWFNQPPIEEVRQQIFSRLPRGRTTP